MPSSDQTSQRKVRPEYRAPANHVHHGRTVAAWVGTSIALVGLLIGGIALLMQNWPLFWAGAALLVVAVIATKVLQSMGRGAN